ncbi:MAG TPA: PepSY domain-containing protein [Arenibaculum sp.]|nr:PepSY domain-containing protein [Arenibaculum sp.]
MKRSAGRLVLGLGVANLTALVMMAAVAAAEGSWGIGDQSLPPDALPMSEVARTLEADGHMRIYGIGVDHGAYLVKATDSDGRRIRVRVDALTGEPL